MRVKVVANQAGLPTSLVSMQYHAMEIAATHQPVPLLSVSSEVKGELSWRMAIEQVRIYTAAGAR